MYVAVKGGERAIENAHRLLAHERRGDREVPEVSLAQISGQISSLARRPGDGQRVRCTIANLQRSPSSRRAAT